MSKTWSLELIHDMGPYPYRVRFMGHSWIRDHAEIVEWCEGRFGKANRHNSVWTINHANFDEVRFSSGENAMMFMLKWS